MLVLNDPPARVLRENRVALLASGYKVVSGPGDRETDQPRARVGAADQVIAGVDHRNFQRRQIYLSSEAYTRPLFGLT